MGDTLRIIVVHSDDSLRRIPNTRFNRLKDGDPYERFPEYAGERVRCVEIIAHLPQRQPVTILRVMYPILIFDADGRLDRRRNEEERNVDRELWNADLGWMIGAMSKEESQREQEYFTTLRDLEFRWIPDGLMERKIKEFAFGRELRRVRN